MKDLCLFYTFTDRGGKDVYNVYHLDDHMTMKRKLGQVRLDRRDIDPDQPPRQEKNNAV